MPPFVLTRSIDCSRAISGQIYANGWLERLIRVGWTKPVFVGSGSLIIGICRHSTTYPADCLSESRGGSNFCDVTHAQRYLQTSRWRLWWEFCSLFLNFLTFFFFFFIFLFLLLEFWEDCGWEVKINKFIFWAVLKGCWKWYEQQKWTSSQLAHFW